MLLVTDGFRCADFRCFHPACVAEIVPALWRYFLRCKAGDRQNGRKKTGNLYLDFLFRIFASNGGYPVVVFQSDYVGLSVLIRLFFQSKRNWNGAELLICGHWKFPLKISVGDGEGTGAAGSKEGILSSISCLAIRIHPQPFRARS